MTINEFILKYRNIKELKDFRGTSMESHYEDGIMRRVMNPHVICNDDFSFSAQASETHYSQPKGLADEYEKIEIGYPSYDDPIISEYREDFGWEDSPMTNAVYGYVKGVGQFCFRCAYFGGVGNKANGEDHDEN